MIALDQETWEGDTLRFRVRALGQTAAASIEVLEDALRIELWLPWLLAKAAKRLLPILRKVSEPIPGEEIEQLAGWRFAARDFTCGPFVFFSTGAGRCHR
jgi:hypothetical protein